MASHHVSLTRGGWLGLRDRPAAGHGGQTTPACVGQLETLCTYQGSAYPGTQGQITGKDREHKHRLCFGLPSEACEKQRALPNGAILMSAGAEHTS